MVVAERYQSYGLDIKLKKDDEFLYSRVDTQSSSDITFTKHLEKDEIEEIMMNKLIDRQKKQEHS